jgi:uncharacterized protein (AIM24 family)
VLEFRLDPGDKIVAESGELSWLSAGIDLKSSLGGGSSQGSLLGAVKRKFAGGSLFMTEYTAHEAGELAFATKVPGHIVEVMVDAQHEYRIHTHGFLCATEGVSLQLSFQQKFSAGLFGGEGFRLQKLVGQGTAFVELSGELVAQTMPLTNLAAVLAPTSRARPQSQPARAPQSAWAHRRPSERLESARTRGRFPSDSETSGPRERGSGIRVLTNSLTNRLHQVEPEGENGVVE